MSWRIRHAGAGALLAAPILVIISAVAQPTLSDDAGKQVAAITSHHGAAIAGMALSLVSVVLLIAGTVWLALRLTTRAPRLGLAGGLLGVFGSLVVLFENGVGAVGPSIVSALDPAQATAVIHHIHTGTAISAIEPVSILGDIGLALLGIAAIRAGMPRWAAAAIAVGALGEGAGFGTGTKSVVIAGFAILFIGLVQAVRAVSAPATSGVAEPGALGEPALSVPAT